MLVMGPLNATLVPLDFADSAAGVVWGRANTQAQLSHIQAEKGNVLLLGYTSKQPCLTVLDNIQLCIHVASQITEQVWTDPVWTWPSNPGERQAFGTAIVGGDEVTQIMPIVGHVEVGKIRIGHTLDEVRAPTSIPVNIMGFLINPDIPGREYHACREAREELPEPSVHPTSVDLAVVRTQLLIAASNGPVSLCPSSYNPDDKRASATPEVSNEQVGEASYEEAPTRDTERPPDELYIVADAEEPPVDTTESAERAGGLNESGVPASSEPASGEVVESPAVPEAMNAEGLADLGAETNTEAAILRLSPVNPGLTAPITFLVHGGIVSVEVSRDVVISRDPDTRAPVSRPVVTILRVLSPQAEISRSHYTVMMTVPDSQALMSLGSASGTIPRHVDSSFQDVTPMVTIALSDDDPIDVGERTTIKFRVR